MSMTKEQMEREARRRAFVYIEQRLDFRPTLLKKWEDQDYDLFRATLRHIMPLIMEERRLQALHRQEQAEAKSERKALIFRRCFDVMLVLSLTAMLLGTWLNMPK